MAIEIKVPILPESVSDAKIAKWYKKPGDSVKQDEHLLDIETDKVVIEVVAPEAGSLESILKKEGDTVKAEEVAALFKPGKLEERNSKAAEATTPIKNLNETLSPAVKRAIGEQGVSPQQIQGTGKEGRITKEDVLRTTQPTQLTQKIKEEVLEKTEFVRLEKRVPMSRIRARIAERLVQAQHTAAILTTFNEINMQHVIEIRQKYKEAFEKAHGVRLGFMSFFTMAVIEALKRFPIVNAFIENDDIIYHDYYDIGIAVSTPRGLVVPVLRNAETYSMANIEKKIVEYADKAKNNHLTIEEITGGTFTITNGGVFGSLMATPIVNPPQSGILGMHKIQERPIAENGAIVIRPMMYVALSYDHRIIDGADSVRFLVTIKEVLEDPARLCLGI